MNQGIFSGRLGRDAEVKQTTKDSVTAFSVATDIGFGDNKRTLWVACSMWGTRGEKVAPYLTKGTPVTVSGDIDLREYTGKDGTAKSEITLNVQRLTLQGRGSQESSPSPAATAPAGGKKTAADLDDPPFGDEKIPF